MSPASGRCPQLHSHLRPGVERHPRFADGYFDAVVSVDAYHYSGTDHRYLQAIASNTAGAPAHKALYDVAGISRFTGASYDDLLDTLMITQRVPAWAGNRTDRAIRLPKRYLVDPALITARLRVDQRRSLRDGDTRADTRHLEWCAERLGPTFATGLVVPTGPRVIRLTDRITAVPIAALWS
jgi:predicted AAA+ superfamily ATPase